MGHYNFVVDTEQPASHFSPYLAAWLGVQTEEGGYLYLYKNEEFPPEIFAWIRDYLLYEGSPEEAVSNYVTPGWHHTGINEIYYKDGEPVDSVIAECKKALETSYSHLIEGFKGELGDPWKEKMSKSKLRALENFKLAAWPACLSMSISFMERPPVDVIDELKKRALAFNDIIQEAKQLLPHIPLDKITITGFRLVRVQTIFIEEKV